MPKYRVSQVASLGALAVALALVGVLGTQNRSLERRYAALAEQARLPYVGLTVPPFDAATLAGVTLRSVWAPNDAELEPCAPMVQRDFDRYEGGFVNIGINVSDAALRSLQRKVLRVSPDGRKILMNSNTSAYDFFLGRVPRTPGWIA
ncbi:MAG: hypothetical protein ACE5I7_13730 [Candidatus Binatia bacterium]